MFKSTSYMIVLIGHVLFLKHSFLHLAGTCDRSKHQTQATEQFQIREGK